MEPTLEEKKILLKTARAAINSVFTGEKISQPDYEKHPIFKTHSGAFVTLTEKNQLRGCIGYIISDQPLFETVYEAAIQASQYDPRFEPVQKSDVQNLALEISILSEPFPLSSYEEIEIGRHGLILEKEGKRGLLLPQVPVEHKMNREQYLDSICRKTGLPADHWRKKQLNLSGFTATVFSDSSVVREVAMKKIREPVVAGMFYPSPANKLKDEIQFLLDTNKSEEKFQNVFGIVSPHAGYAYSGRTAAIAFNALADKNYKTVIIISPSHREYFPGISIYSGDAYKTPLGEITVNKEMVSKLTSDGKFIFEGLNGHRTEHAVEVQLPFLQTVLNDFSIVPIILGDQRKLFNDGLAQKLAEVMDDETLIIASSDLSHFHSKTEAFKLDSIVEKRITDFDYDGLQNDLETGKCEACGGGGIIAMMRAADLLSKRKSKVLSHTDSGDITGDDAEVVGYLSAVVFG